MEPIKWREPNPWRRKGRAFLDGVYTGLDFVGTVVGHITKNKAFLGYRADVYSNKPGSLMDYIEPVESANNMEKIEFAPMERSVDEQIIKGVGDVVGLAPGLLAIVSQHTYLLLVPHVAAFTNDTINLANKGLDYLLHRSYHIEHQKAQEQLASK